MMQKSPTPSKAILTKLYIDRKKSMKDIASILKCSVHKVTYWMSRYRIPRRSISEASYLKHHPKGDPFTFRPPKTPRDRYLFGLGIGLYWGEGTKANKWAVRLGNTDPRLIQVFMRFLIKFFSTKKSDLHFGLQIFSDINPRVALRHWMRVLEVPRDQFYKVTVTKSGSIGTYRKKSRYGVLTLYYNNKKLRDLLVSHLPP